jgi:multidrug transporter EmrE-like cation transporter
MFQQLTNAIAAQPFFHTLHYGILSMVLVGSSWCLTGLVMGDAPKRNLDAGIVQLFGALLSLLLSLLILFATGGFPPVPTQVFLLTCGAIALGNILNVFMLTEMSRAMQIGPNGIVWSIIQSAMVFPYIGGILFFHVQVTILRTIGILLLLTSLVGFGLCKDTTGKARKGWRIHAFIGLALAAIQQNLTTAPSYFEAAKAVTSIMRTCSGIVGTLIGVILYLTFRKKTGAVAEIRAAVRNTVLWKYLAALQTFSIFTTYLLFFPGLNILADAGLGNISYPMMVGSCIIAFTLTSAIILKEKITSFQCMALLLCVAGLVCICL